MIAGTAGMGAFEIGGAIFIILASLIFFYGVVWTWRDWSKWNKKNKGDK